MSSFFSLFSLPPAVVKYNWGYDANNHLQIELLDAKDIHQGWITHLSGDKFLYSQKVIKVGWEMQDDPHPWESSEFLPPSGEGGYPINIF